MPRWRVASLASALLLLSTASGQQVPTSDGLRAKAPDRADTKSDDPNIDLVEWGWGRFDEGIPGETFAPVTVWISSGDKAWSGTLRLTYNQDQTQDAVIEVPVSTTPGNSTPIELTVVIPNGCEKATAELFGEGKRDRRTFANIPSSTQLPFPMASSTPSRILIVGDSSARTLWERMTVADVEAEGQPAGPVMHTIPGTSVATADRWQAYWNGAITTSIKPDRLPQAWAAYEGLDLVILGPDAWDQIDPRSRAALQTWVWSGGRLLLEAPAAGSSWANIFPVWAGETPIALNPQSTVTIPAHLFDLPDSFRELPTSQRPSPASSRPILARRIELTSRGEADGWRVAWPSGNDETGKSGVFAVGPAGFGFVGVISVEPSRIIGMLDSARIRRVWREAVREVVALRTDPEYGWAWYGGNSAPDMMTGTALTTTLDYTARGKPLGTGVFLILLGGVGILALLVGPFDAIVLRRMRKSHHSWATALAWTGLASLFAAAAPSLVHSGGSNYGRVRVIDTLALEPPVSASTVATGIFGARSGRVRLMDEGPGTFVRGVSALQSWSSSSSTAFSPILLAQRSSRADPSLRESVANDVRLGQWTFRTLLAQTPARQDPAAMSARIEGDPEAPTIVLLNVPVSASIQQARVRIGEHLYTITFDPPEAAAAGATLSTRRGEAAKIVGPPINLDGTGVLVVNPSTYPYPNAQSDEQAPSFSLMGPLQRRNSSECRRKGGWGVVELLLSDACPPTPGERNTEYFERTYCRIAVPLPESLTETTESDVAP